MIKTIKVKKRLRLDELIKYAFDNGIEQTTFHSDIGGAVSFDMFGRFEAIGHVIISPASTFTVEVDEEITDVTKLPFPVLMVYKSEEQDRTFYKPNHLNPTIAQVKNTKILHGNLETEKVNATHVYELNEDGTIGQLIWDKERDFR